MPDETRQPDPLEARAKEIVREYFAYLRGQQTYPPMIALERMVLAALRTVQQETARETWERAARVADQWAHSHSCSAHEDNPCCHVRTGAGIADAIRQAATREDH